MTKRHGRKREREQIEALCFVVRLADETDETGRDAFTNLAEAGAEARRALDGPTRGPDPDLAGLAAAALEAARRVALGPDGADFLDSVDVLADRLAELDAAAAPRAEAWAAGVVGRMVDRARPAGELEGPRRRPLVRLAAGLVIAVAWSWSAVRVAVISWTGPAGVLAWGPPFGRTVAAPLRAVRTEAENVRGHALALAGIVHEARRLYRDKAGALAQGAEAGAAVAFGAYVAACAVRLVAAVGRRFWRTLAGDLGLVEVPGRTVSPRAGFLTGRACILAGRVGNPYREARGARAVGSAALAWGRLRAGFELGTPWPVRLDGRTVEAARLAAAVIRSAAAVPRLVYVAATPWASRCRPCESVRCSWRPWRRALVAVWRAPWSWRNRGARAALRAWTRARTAFWSVCLALSPGPAGRSYRARPRPGRPRWSWRRARLALFGPSWALAWPYTWRAWIRTEPRLTGALAGPCAESAALTEAVRVAARMPCMALSYLGLVRSTGKADKAKRTQSRRPRPDVRAAAAVLAVGLWVAVCAAVRLGRLFLAAVEYATDRAARCPAPASWGRHGAEDGRALVLAVVLALVLVVAALVAAAGARAVVSDALRGHAETVAAALVP